MVEKALTQDPENFFSRLLTCFWYFFMIMLPARQWKINAVATGQSQKPISRLLKYLCSESLDATPLLGFLLGLILFLTYCGACALLEYALQPFVGYYYATQALPVGVVPLSLPLLLFLLRINDFSKLSFSTGWKMYACVATMTGVCDIATELGFIYALLFIFFTLISLHATFGQTSAALRWFYRIFVMCFSHMAVAKAISLFYLGILSPVTTALLHVCVVAMYLSAFAFIYCKANQPILIHDEYNERFFQRGNEQAQMQYVTRHMHTFLILTAISAICTFGQFGPSSTGDVPEAMANVFCKVSSPKQLQCMVNVTYYDPAKSESGEQWTEDSSKWDFCGSLPCYLL